MYYKLLCLCKNCKCAFFYLVLIIYRSNLNAFYFVLVKLNHKAEDNFNWTAPVKDFCLMLITC